MYQHLLLATFSQIPPERIEPELLQVFKHQQIAPHLHVLSSCSTKHNLLSNYSQALRVAAKSERVSGFFRGSLGTMLSDETDKAEAAEVLGISTRSITRALLHAREKLRDSLLTGKHNKFVTKTQYKASRLPVEPSLVTNWILDHCRASANSSNVVRQREANGSWGFQVMHYRDSSIGELFQQYKVPIPSTRRASIFYFY